jgi:hypothetical protein
MAAAVNAPKLATGHDVGVPSRKSQFSLLAHVNFALSAVTVQFKHSTHILL